MIQIWICVAGLSLSTIIGSILGFIFKSIPHKWNDIILGFCAGVMLAASTIGLILPATEQAGGSAWRTISIGVIVGLLFLNLLDMVTPHLHRLTGLEQEVHQNNSSIDRILLFVMAIEFGCPSSLKVQSGRFCRLR